MEGLTPGRQVHYIAYGTPGGEYEAGAHRAATITEVLDEEAGVVSLCVFNPTGLHFNRSIPHMPADEFVPGTWHWIERA